MFKFLIKENDVCGIDEHHLHTIAWQQQHHGVVKTFYSRKPIEKTEITQKNPTKTSILDFQGSETKVPFSVQQQPCSNTWGLSQETFKCLGVKIKDMSQSG